jgi:hypothetical protein
MYFGDYVIKEKTKWEIFLYFTKTNWKGCRHQMRLMKKSEVQNSVYNKMLRN